MAASLDLDLVQSSFPALKPGFVFADNAGGSQVLQSSVDLVIDYLVNTNAQMGGQCERCRPRIAAFLG